MKRFSGLWKHLILQILGGGAVIGALLFLTDALLSEVMVASFGATVFILVTAPQAQNSGPRNLIGGYACGCASGLIHAAFSLILPGLPLALWGGLAVGLAVFLMLLLKVPHPPAGALALGVVLSAHPFRAAGIAFAGILIVNLLFLPLRKHLKNLS